MILKRRDASNAWLPVVQPNFAQPVETLGATYTVRHFEADGADPHYYLIKVFRDPSARIIRKQLSYDVAGTEDAVTTKEHIADFASRVGANIVVNGSAWPVSNLRGVQIKDGVLLQDWEVNGVNGLGGEVLASMSDGSLKIFDEATYSAQDLLDLGVMDTWSHSAALIKDGVTVANSGTYNWSVQSAMNIAGCDGAGNYMFLQSYGISGSAGFTMAQVTALAEDLGFYQAVTLDGGGSAQSLVDGTIVMPSSDGAPRAVPDFIYLNASMVKDALDDGWHDLTLEAGITAMGSNRYRLVKGEGGGRGLLELNINLSSGVAVSGVIATLPIEARPPEFQPLSATSNGGVVASVGVNTNGTITALNGTGFDNTKAIRVYGRVPLD